MEGSCSPGFSSSPFPSQVRPPAHFPLPPLPSKLSWFLALPLSTFCLPLLRGKEAKNKKRLNTPHTSTSYLFQKLQCFQGFQTKRSVNQNPLLLILMTPVISPHAYLLAAESQENPCFPFFFFFFSHCISSPLSHAIKRKSSLVTNRN